MNNSGYQAIYWQPNGFVLLKQHAENYIVQHHRTASFPTLLRECGSFFGTTIRPTRLVVRGNAPLLVPNELFTSTNDNCWKNLIELAENDIIMADELDDYMLLYSAPIKKIDQLRQNGMSPIFQHNATILARYLALNYTDYPNRLAFSFAANTADYVLFSSSKMVMVNTLRYSNAEELVYLIANILQQQEIVASDCTILFSGELPDAKKVYDTVNSYFPTLAWAGNFIPIHIQTPSGRTIPASDVLTLLPF